MPNSTAEPRLSLLAPSTGKPVPEVPPLVYTPGFSLYNTPIKDTQWLVEGLIPRETIFCLNGRGGVFKSWTMTSIAISVAGGVKLMDKFKCPIYEPFNSVLFIQIEERRWQTTKKYRWLLNTLRPDPQWIQDLQVGFIIDQPFRMDDPRRMDQLKVIIDDTQPDLVLWDNARKMKAGNENDSEWGDALIFGLRELQAVYPSAHGIIHHWRKKSADKEMNDPDEMGRGNAALRDGVDLWLPVQLHQAEDPKDSFVTLIAGKPRDAEPFKPFNYRVRIHNQEGMAALEYIGIATDSEEGGAAAILDLLRTDRRRDWTRPEIKELLGENWTSNQVEYAVSRLRQEGKILVEAAGRGRKAATIRLVEFREPELSGIKPELGLPYND